MYWRSQRIKVSVVTHVRNESTVGGATTRHTDSQQSVRRRLAILQNPSTLYRGEVLTIEYVVKFDLEAGNNTPMAYYASEVIF